MLMSLIMLIGFIVIIALPSILWLYALADAIINDFERFLTKMVWIIVLLLFPPLGTLLYYLIGRNQRITLRPVGRILILAICIVPALMILAYILYALGHLTFMPSPPQTIQI